MRERITHKFWDFIEKYLPNYYHRDDMLRQSDLQQFIDGRESSVEGISMDEAKSELSVLLLKFFFEAIETYTNGYGDECDDCRLHKHFAYCPVCGKKRNPDG